MLYLIAIFFPWLALLLAGRPFQALMSMVLSLFTVVGLLFFLLPGLILWVLSIAHAFAVISGARAEKQTRRILAAVREVRDAPVQAAATPHDAQPGAKVAP